MLHRFRFVYSGVMIALRALNVVVICPGREIGTSEGQAALCHALLRRITADSGAQSESKGSHKESGQIHGHMQVETAKANKRLSGMSCMLTARFRGTLCLTASASLLSSSWSGHVEVIH